MLVVKRWQPNAFFAFSFTLRLIVNAVRREKKSREKKKRKKKTKTTMMLMMMTVVVVRCSRVLRTTVRTSTKHCRRSMMLLTYSTFYLVTCWCYIQTIRSLLWKKRKERKKKEEKKGRKKSSFFLSFLLFLWFFAEHCVWIKSYPNIQLIVRNNKCKRKKIH